MAKLINPINNKEVIMRKSSITNFFKTGSLKSLDRKEIANYKILRDYVFETLQTNFGTPIQEIFTTLHTLLNRYQLTPTEFKDLTTAYEKSKMITSLINEIIGLFEEVLNSYVKQKKGELEVDTIKNKIKNFIATNEKNKDEIEKVNLILDKLSEKIDKFKKVLAKEYEVVTEENELLEIFCTSGDFNNMINEPARIKEKPRKSSLSKRLSRRFSFSSERPFSLEETQLQPDKKDEEEILELLKINLPDENQNDEIFYNRNFIKSLIIYLKDHKDLIKSDRLKEIIKVLIAIQSYNSEQTQISDERSMIQKFYSHLLVYKNDRSDNMTFTHFSETRINTVIFLPRIPFFVKEAHFNTFIRAMIYFIFKPTNVLLEDIIKNIILTKKFDNQYGIKVKGTEEFKTYEDFLKSCGEILSKIYEIFTSEKELFKEFDDGIKVNIFTKLEKLKKDFDDCDLSCLLDNFKTSISAYLDSYKKFKTILFNCDPVTKKQNATLLDYLYQDSTIKSEDACKFFCDYYINKRNELSEKKASDTITREEKNFLNFSLSIYHTSEEERSKISLFSLNKNIHIFNGSKIMSMDEYLIGIKTYGVDFLFFNLFPDNFTVQNIYQQFQPFIKPKIYRTTSAPEPKKEEKASLTKRSISAPGATQQ